MSIKRSSKEERIPQILDTAQELFSSKGFDKTTLDEIAEKISLTKPALYLYFKSKQDIINSLFQTRFSKINEDLDIHLATCSSGLEKLKTFVHIVVEFNKKNSSLFRTIHQSKTKKKVNPNQNHSPIRIQYNRFLSIISGIITECVNEEKCRKENISFYTYSLMGIINQNFFGPLMSNKKPDPPTDLADRIIQLFLQGAQK